MLCFLQTSREVICCLTEISKAAQGRLGQMLRFFYHIPELSFHRSSIVAKKDADCQLYVRDTNTQTNRGIESTGWPGVLLHRSQLLLSHCNLPSAVQTNRGSVYIG